jgi:hypothetical protein
MTLADGTLRNRHQVTVDPDPRACALSSQEINYFVYQYFIAKQDTDFAT